jgi:hypothetical protein
MEQVTADKLQEVLERTRRVETRLTRLCMGLNVDVMGARSKIAIGYIPGPPGSLGPGQKVMELGGLDVGVGECLQFAKDKGIVGEIRLYHGGVQVGSISGVAGS